MSKMVRGLTVVLIAVVLWFLPVPEGMEAAAWHLFAIFVATIFGFILKPLPMGAVAFAAFTSVALFKVAKPGAALAGFSNTTIWLIVSAFLFARGFIKTGLGNRIAYTIMKAIGNSTLKLAYAIQLSDFVISPATPSNTARGGGILFPIVRSLVLAFGSTPDKSPKRMGAFIMQSAFHGNMTTSAMFMTSQASNPLVVALALKLFGVDFSWGDWALAAIVPGIVSMLAIPFLLYKLEPPEIKETPEAPAIAQKALDEMGAVSRNERIAGIVFIGALLLWATSSYNGINATVVALLGVTVMLFTGVLEWKDVTHEYGAWDTMIWMGTLVGLAGLLNSTGFIKWFAAFVSAQVSGFSWFAALVILSLLYMYSHYAFASLSAHVTAMFPALAPVAVAAGAPAVLVTMIFGAFSNLCASITHYSTGPAPIYFGQGYVDQGTWWRNGFIVSLANLVIWFVVGGAWWKIIGLW